MNGARAVALAMSVALAAVPMSIALADDAGPPAGGGPAPAGSTGGGAGAGSASGSAAGGGGASAPAEGDSDESDHSAPSPTPKPAPAARVPYVIKDGMVRVPGGRFTMGSQDRNAPPNERPARAVTTPAFWIDRTEVTVGAYRECVDRGACKLPAKTSTACTYDAGDPMLPVSCVGWSSAQTYCIAVGKRLPREVEWEVAARGTYAYRYPWGGGGSGCYAAVTLVNEKTQRSCSQRRPARVGSHATGASPYGALDMSGNVEEWVEDWYAETLSDLSPRAGSSHVLRGGGWLSPPSLAKTTTRNWGSVKEEGPNVGFRCAKDD